MTEEPSRATVPADSELASHLKNAEATLEVSTGESVYQLYICSRETLAPTQEQTARTQAGIRKAAGGWVGLVDAEEFKAYVARRRRGGSRPSVRL